MMGGVSELVARLVVAMISMAVGSYALACFCDPAAWVTDVYKRQVPFGAAAPMVSRLILPAITLPPLWSTWFPMISVLPGEVKKSEMCIRDRYSIYSIAC